MPGSYLEADDIQDALFCKDYPYDDPEHNPMRAIWYNLNDVLAWSIIPALDQMITNCHGYPSELLPEEFQHVGGWMTAEHKEAAKYAYEEWLSILRDIRRGFIAYRCSLSLFRSQFEDEQTYLEAKHRLLKMQTQGLRLFAEWYPSLWD